MEKHLWYLLKANIGLAFLDKCITYEEKKLMFHNLGEAGWEVRTKKIRRGKNTFFQGKHLSDCITHCTKIFLEMFGIIDIEEYYRDTLRNSINAFRVGDNCIEGHCLDTRIQQL